MADDNVQHGIDDNPSGDGEKGAVLGGIGGAVVGALAGGPVGAVIGAVAGAAGSGLGVAAVDRVDNDNTVSGLGDGATTDAEVSTSHAVNAVTPDAPVGGHNIVTGDEARTDDGKTGLGTGAVVGGVVGTAVGGPVGAVVGGALGSVAGGVAGDANEAAKRDDISSDAHNTHSDNTGGRTL